MAGRSKKTRERLLAAACELFAEHGFGDTTVAAICERAGANVAAVSYHFGSKERLYVAAWRHAHQAMLAACPPDGGAGADAPPAERLRGRIRSLVRAALGEHDTAFRIMHHEMTQPTGLLREVFRESIRPLRRLTAGIVAELLGPGADERTVRLCTMSVTAPCHQMLRLRRLRRHLRRQAWPGDDAEEVLVEQFTSFALGGIECLRQARGREARAPQQQGASA